MVEEDDSRWSKKAAVGGEDFRRTRTKDGESRRIASHPQPGCVEGLKSTAYIISAGGHPANVLGRPPRSSAAAAAARGSISGSGVGRSTMDAYAVAKAEAAAAAAAAATPAAARVAPCVRPAPKRTAGAGACALFALAHRKRLSSRGPLFSRSSLSGAKHLRGRAPGTLSRVCDQRRHAHARRRATGEVGGVGAAPCSAIASARARRCPCWGRGREWEPARGGGSGTSTEGGAPMDTHCLLASTPPTSVVPLFPPRPTSMTPSFGTLR